MHICPGCAEPRSEHAFRLHWHTVRGRKYVHRERVCNVCEARASKRRRLQRAQCYDPPSPRTIAGDVEDAREGFR
jgi:hypothetical protein